MCFSDCPMHEGHVASPILLPEGVRYDGAMRTHDSTLHLFTDTAETSGTFGVSDDELSESRVAQELTALRERFAGNP